MNTWVDSYLTLIGEKKENPTLDYFQRLTEAHLHRVPFEIISKYHYFSTRPLESLIPDREEYLQNAIEYGWGGNCYILNIHFGQLFKELGFDVHYIRARGGNNHLALRVMIEGKAYYTDVGYMAPLFEPVLLEAEPYIVRCGEEIIIKKENDQEYMIDRRSGGQSFVMKTIEWWPVEVSSFKEDIIHSHRDEDENPFMRRIVATIFKDRVSYSVINSKLLIKSNSDVKVVDFKDKEKWIHMMKDTFNFQEKGIKFALEFLEERGVTLF
jgi:N-hydroxyarylamine O-acetyltransferase